MLSLEYFLLPQQREEEAVIISIRITCMMQETESLNDDFKSLLAVKK